METNYDNLTLINDFLVYDFVPTKTKLVQKVVITDSILIILQFAVHLPGHYSNVLIWDLNKTNF